jgi:hypothetical protein
MIDQTRKAKELVKEHLQALHISSELTLWFRRARQPQVEKVTPEGIIAALHREGINPVLMGTHGLVVYRSESRATQDVDLLVVKKDVRKAVRVLEREYPYLEIHDSAVVTRMVDPVSQKVVIDVIKPESRAMQMVFRHTLKIGDTHRIPELEMALACKFVSMMAPNRRDAKKMVDLGDFIDVVQNKRDVLDLEKLKRFAGPLFPKGGTAIMRLVEEIDSGRPVHPPWL